MGERERQSKKDRRKDRRKGRSKGIKREIESLIEKQKKHSIAVGLDLLKCQDNLPSDCNKIIIFAMHDL